MNFRFSIFLRSSFCVQLTFKGFLLSFWLLFGVLDVLNGRLKIFSQSVRNGRVSAVVSNVNKCRLKRISKSFLKPFVKSFHCFVSFHCFDSIKDTTHVLVSVNKARNSQDLHPLAVLVVLVVVGAVVTVVVKEYHCNPFLNNLWRSNAICDSSRLTYLSGSTF